MFPYRFAAGLELTNPVRDTHVSVRVGCKNAIDVYPIARRHPERLAACDAAAKDLLLRQNVGSLPIDLHTRIIESHLSANVFLEEHESEPPSADVASIDHLDFAKADERSPHIGLRRVVRHPVDINCVRHCTTGEKSAGSDKAGSRVRGGTCLSGGWGHWCPRRCQARRGVVVVGKLPQHIHAVSPMI